MSKDKIYMCSNCDTLFDTSEEALECCQCENCAALKKQLKALQKENSEWKGRVKRLNQIIADDSEQLEAVRALPEKWRRRDKFKLAFLGEQCADDLEEALQGEKE